MGGHAWSVKDNGGTTPPSCAFWDNQVEFWTVEQQLLDIRNLGVRYILRFFRRAFLFALAGLISI